MNSNVVHHTHHSASQHHHVSSPSSGTSAAAAAMPTTAHHIQNNTPDRPPPPPPQIFSPGAAQAQPSQAYRSPPPIPTTPPPTDSDAVDSSSTTPPPQAPARSSVKTSRSKLTTTPGRQQQQQLDPTPTTTSLSVSASKSINEQQTPNVSQVVSNQSHESAKNAAVKLVQNKLMMGSVPTLSASNQNSVNNENEPPPQTLKASIVPNNIDLAGSGDMTNGRNVLGANNINQASSMTSTETRGPAQQPPPPSQSSSSASQPQSKHLGRTNSSVKHRPAQSSSSQNNLPWNPISGEMINREENEPMYSEIIFVMPDNRGVRGKLYISNFRLYFISEETYSFNNFHSHLIIDVPLGLINRVEKIGHQSSKQANFYGILISCKNGRRLRFANTQLKGSRKQIYELIQRYAFPLSFGSNYFAFKYLESFGDNLGWMCYDIRQEYERMGISKSDDWRLSEINKDFQFCDTYPKLLVVPKKIDDAELRQVAEFRSKKRIPVVSWLKFDNRKNNVALLRSSQPLTGLMTKRSEKDEFYLHTVFSLNQSNSGDKLYILDARPSANAYANRATGGGFESPDNYKECEIHFLNIHNIHVMRESLRKIFDMAMPPSVSSSSSSAGGATSGSSGLSSTAIGNLVTSNPTHHRSTSFGAGGDASRGNVANSGGSGNAGGSSGGSGSGAAGGSGNAHQSHSSLNDDRNFFVNLENSKWLEHIKSLLNGALRIVRYITVHDASVLVHCSDGWDRTAQLTSLSMLMMDKYYRTIKGFQVLIEKEWISFGHRFGTRMGHGSDKYSDQDRSPIFLQFIDCVWQIMQQNSKVFEFNEKLLLFIVNNMYTCQFGTFLYNNENERERHDVRNKTVSLWSYINSKDFRNEYRNNAYIEYDGVVECSTSLSSLQLWVAYYFQYREVIDDTLNSLSAQNPAVLGLKNTNSSQNMYTFTPPMPSNRMFGQAFFQQVVSQMKATVRNHAPQEPELVRYKACVHSAE